MSIFRGDRRFSRKPRPKGSTLVESAIVLTICMFLLFAMLETGIVVIQYTAMSEAARRVARAAIVHGKLASAAQGTWGPATVSTNAGSGDPIAQATRTVLLTLDPSDVAIDVDWLEGGNRPDQPVRVSVSYTHYAIVPIPGLYSHVDLQATSTMRIAH